MADSKTHKQVGLIVGSVIAFSTNIGLQYDEQTDNPDSKFSWFESIISAFLGGIFGRFTGLLPDLIEPATNPHHRKFFHSWLFLMILLFSGYFLLKKHRRKRVLCSVIAGSLGSYSSHIIMDATTPMSVKLF